MLITDKTSFILSGSVTEPKLESYGAEKKPILKFGVAVGKSNDITEWANVVAFSKLTGLKIHKGDAVFVTGYIKSWENKEGKQFKNYVAEIIQVQQYSADSMPEF